jgi:GPH family glycoside/pentoside/hexuronide:cation symporter
MKAHSVRPTLTVLEKVGYGLGDTATNLVWRTLMVFLPIFYTDVFGLPAAAVGTLLLVCRYWDGITDIAMGLIADRTSTRWGKFRPWILWTALPFGVMTVLTFTAVDLAPDAKLLYAYATYGGLVLVFTASNIPYSALTGVLTADPVERTSLSGYRFVFAFLGGLITQGLNIPLVRFFGGGDEVEGYRWTMTLFAGLSVFLFLVTFFTTRERVTPLPAKTATLKADVADLFRNRPWVILFFVGLMFVTLATLKQGVTMYYFKYYVRDLPLAPAFMIAGLLAAMLGAALTSPLVRRLGGNRRVLDVAFGLAFLTSALLYLAGPEDIALIFVLSTITEFATGPIVALFFAMLGDAADYSEWKSGRRATGLVFSAGTLSMKFGTGIAGALTGWVLTLFGYVANAEQSPETLTGIRLLISVLPALAAIAAIGVLRFYPIDARMAAQITTDLKSRSSEVSR